MLPSNSTSFNASSSFPSSADGVGTQRRLVASSKQAADSHNHNHTGKYSSSKMDLAESTSDTMRNPQRPDITAATAAVFLDRSLRAMKFAPGSSVFRCWEEARRAVNDAFLKVPLAFPTPIPLVLSSQTGLLFAAEPDNANYSSADSNSVYLQESQPETPALHASSPSSVSANMSQNVVSRHPAHLLRETELNSGVRVVSATVGALLTSLLVTPFDVVKTRLQSQFNYLQTHLHLPHTRTDSSLSGSQGNGSVKSAVNALHARNAIVSSTPTTATPFVPRSMDYIQHCPYYRTHDGLADAWTFNPRFTPSSSTAALFPSSPPVEASASPLRLHGPLDAAYKLIRHEGAWSLWRGLQPTLLMSIPSTVVYFAAYDQIKLSLEAYSKRHSSILSLSPSVSLAPLIAGSTARALATVLVSPIELARTRLQASRHFHNMFEVFRHEIQVGGVRSLWRGASPTLWRDVPFSAIYWSCYEQLQVYFGHKVSWAATEDERSKRIVTAFLSGAIAGMIAATSTQPFDLVKTRRQILLYQLFDSTSAKSASTPSSTTAILRTIVAEEGWKGLMSGWSARVAKIVPACAIMISSYEAAKQFFGVKSIEYQDKIHPQQHD